MVGIRKIITNNQHFKDVEYMIWKDYAMSPESQNELRVAAKKLVSDGQKEAPLTIYQTESGARGLSLNVFENNSRRYAIEQSFAEKRVRGYQILTEFTDGFSHNMKVNPGSKEVVVYKMHPNCTEFAGEVVTTQLFLSEEVDKTENDFVENLLTKKVPSPGVDRQGIDSKKMETALQRKYFHKNKKPVSQPPQEPKEPVVA